MMNNKLLKYLSLIFIGVVSFIFSLVKYILSFEYYADEYIVDISFNSDYIVAMLISIVLAVCGILQLVALKNKKENKLIPIYSGLLISSVLTLYFLGYLFKQLNKGKLFVDYLNYFFVGIVGLGILCYFIFNYLENRKKSDN